MTKEKQIEQYKLAAEILEKGLQWQWAYDGKGDWFNPITKGYDAILRELLGERGQVEIRIKPQPEPENKYLKAFKEGKRVRSSGGIYAEREADIKFWLTHGAKMTILTTRTVPLTYDDVMPGVVVKTKDFEKKHLVSSVDSLRIFVDDWGYASYQDLSLGFLRWDGAAWIPCTKEVEEVEE